MDGVRRWAAIFGSPDMFDWVYVRALAGSLNDIQGVVTKSLLRSLGCVLRVIVLLESEPLAQAEVLSSLTRFSLWISLDFSPFIFLPSPHRISGAQPE